MYNPLARFYEEIFPVSESQIHFVESTLTKNREQLRPRLLEVGCAVGDLAAAVAAKGIEVDAIDLNPSMIQQARNRHDRHTKAGLLRFHEMNMLDIDSKFEADSFDTVACLGNTLVHLPGPVEIERFLQAAARLLRTSDISRAGETGGKSSHHGKLVLQILNYDHLLEEKPKKLPLIETPQLRFEREYSYNTGSGIGSGVIRIVFTTRLELKQSGKTYEDSVELYPLQRRELESLLENAGFSRIQFYGGFDGTPLTPESFPLIAAAESAPRVSSSTR